MSDWLTVDDVARELNFAAKTVRSWCQQGIFPGATKWPNNSRGAHWRIPRTDVEALKRERMGEAPTVSGSRLDELMDAALAAL